MLIHLLGCSDPKDYPPDLFPLQDDEHYIGRLPSCHIRMDDDSISRLHARIFRKDGDWWIEDIRSRNGVLINGRSVNSAKLVEGDIITTGEAYLTLSHRRADQIEHIRDWVEERVHDALSYNQQIIKLNAQKTLDKVSSLIESVPPVKTPEESTQIPVAETLTPDSATTSPAPPQISIPTAPPTPARVPETAVPHRPPVHQPQVHQPQPRPLASNRPGAQNVIGSDPTVIIVLSVTGALIVAALIWKFAL